MKESKKRLVKDVAAKIDKLPEDNKQYILGIMDGIMLSSGNSRREEKQGKEVSEWKTNGRNLYLQYLN